MKIRRTWAATMGFITGCALATVMERTDNKAVIVPVLIVSIFAQIMAMFVADSGR